MKKAMQLLKELNELQHTIWAIHIHDDFSGGVLDELDESVFIFTSKKELKKKLQKRINKLRT